MKKKLLIVVGVVVVLLAVFGAVSIGRNRQTDQKIEEIVQEGSEASAEGGQSDGAMVSLDEARDALSVMMEKGKNGEYRNLEFEEFTPFMTEEDEVCALKIYPPKKEATVEDIPELVEFIQSFYPEEVREDCLWINNIDVGLSIEELKEELESGNPKYVDGYVMAYKDGEKYAQINNTLCVIWIDLGVEGSGPSDEDLLDKAYYMGATDGSLDDTYETATGTMSVREAAAQTEAYFNEDFPLPLGEGLTYKTSHVWIYPMQDNTFAFFLSLRRSYGGVVFEEFDDVYYDDADGLRALLDGENHLSFFHGLDCNRTVEVTETYSEILSPEKAAEYLSQKIGDNTVYAVSGIELSYKGTELEFGQEENPAWIFLTVNQTNGKETRFYVDAVTGEVDTRVM